MQTRHSKLWKRTAIVAAVLVLLTVSVLGGCTVKLIGDYDDTIDKGISDVQQRAELYFSKLQSTPNTPYDQSFYDDIDSRLAVLKSRAAALPKDTIIIEQIGNLRSQFDNFEKLDKASPRPFPAVAVPDAESAVAVSVESILKLELAMKRGATGTAPSKN